MSHLLLSSSLTRGDKCIHCGWGIQSCPPLGLVPNTFPPVKALEFSTSPILVSLLCDLKNYAIVGSALPVQRFFIINLIEQGYLLIVGYPMIF
jgi:ferredoxin